MAKTYAAELMLKNKNLIQSLDQAIKKTKELKKQLEKPIEVDAKLGSSFKNIESRINKITPKEKVIKITATEDVTKTMNNVQRNMFEMSNKMNSSLTSSMKGFSSSISASLPKLQAMSNTMAAVANSSKLASSIAHASTASGLAGAGAGLAGAAVLGGKDMMTPTGNRISSKWYKKRLKMIDSYLNPVGLGNIFRAGKESALRNDIIKGDNKYLKNFGAKGFFNDIEEDDEFFQKWAGQFKNPKNLRIVDEAFQRMIERQQDKMAKLGKSNYLSKYMSVANEGTKTGLGMYNVKRANKDMNLIQKTSRYFNRQVAIAQLYAKSLTFSPAYEKMKSGATKVFNFVKRQGLKAWYAVERGVFKAGHSVGTIQESFSRVATRIKSVADRVFGKLFKEIPKEAQKETKKAAQKAIKNFTDMSNKIASTITKGIGNAFKKVVSMGKWAAGAVAGAFGLGIKDMATQEQYITSMSHFISVDDAKANGKNTITKDQAKQRAEGLFDWGTKFANSTPFQNAEVYSAINRMTQVFGYGTDGAQIQKMVKLVGDMAALNPGKSMSGAAEAVADLAMGETERMKEFGLKLTQDDLKALAGVPDQKDSLSQEQIMKAFDVLTSSGGQMFETFDGGADALSQTMSGKVSTILGKFRQSIVDSMKPFENDFKAVLDNVIGHLDGAFGSKFKSTLSKVFEGAKDILTGNKESDIPMVGSIIRAFEILKSAIAPIIDNIKSKFGETGFSFETVGKLIENAIGGISIVISAVTPIINGFINVATWVVNAFAEHPALFKAIGAAIGGLTVISSIVGLFTGAIAVFNTVSTIVNGVKAAFTLLQILGLGPVALGIAGVIAVGTLLIANWQTVCTWAQNAKNYACELWETFKQNPLEAMTKLFNDMGEGIKRCVGFFGDLINKAKEWANTKIVNPVKNFFGGGGDKGSQNAYGKNRVPYDGYRASLHEGERVLTARQAAQMDAGLLPGQATSNNNNITINVSGTTDPDTTARMVVQRLKETLENTSVKSFA